MIETTVTTDVQAIEIVDIDHPLYPALLRNTCFPQEVQVGDYLVPIDIDPPSELFTTDEHVPFDVTTPDRTNPPIAIIGTHDASPIGKLVAAAFASCITDMGHHHIGRLNEGIDGHAAIGAAGNGGHTFAILPRAIEHIYPGQADSIVKRIKPRLTLASEYTLAGDVALANNLDKQRFRDMDRIVAGAAEAVVIVEGTTNSSEHRLLEIALCIGRPVIVVTPSYKMPGKYSRNKQLSYEVSTNPRYRENPLIHTLTVKAWTDHAGDLRFGEGLQEIRELLEEIKYPNG